MVLAVRVCSRGRARRPPPGGLRAPLPAAPQCGAAAGSVVLRPLRRPRVPFRGGPGPPRRCPVAARCAPARPRAAALRFGRGRPPSARARLASLPPFAVSGRRGGRFGRCAACSLPCARGAPPPSAASPFVRVGAARCPPRPLVPASLRPRGLRRVVPAPRRPAPVAAARLRLGAAPPCQCPAAAGPGGRAAAGGAPGPAAAGPVLGRSRAPRVGFGVCAAAAALFFAAAAARCCRAPQQPRFGFARAARPPCLRLRPPSHADGRATAARPFCAFGAFVVQREGELQGITQSATYCADYSLDIPYTGEFGKTRIILPNYLWILSIDTAPYFWYALIRI